LRSDGCFVPPLPEEPTITFDFDFLELTPKSLFGLPIARGRLTAVLTGDDPTTYSYSWNFDVTNLGAGFGDTAARITTAEWRMNTQDIVNLIGSAGVTTRSVEVVATKGTKIFRVRKTVEFKDPALKFLTPPDPFDDPLPREPDEDPDNTEIVPNGGGTGGGGTGGGGGGGSDENGDTETRIL
jgi:hypothetical protein